jgi:hypothetical protein
MGCAAPPAGELAGDLTGAVATVAAMPLAINRAEALPGLVKNRDEGDQIATPSEKLLE